MEAANLPVPSRQSYIYASLDAGLPPPIQDIIVEYERSNVFLEQGKFITDLGKKYTMALSRGSGITLTFPQHSQKRLLEQIGVVFQVIQDEGLLHKNLRKDQVWDADQLAVMKRLRILDCMEQIVAFINPKSALLRLMYTTRMEFQSKYFWTILPTVTYGRSNTMNPITLKSELIKEETMVTVENNLIVYVHDIFPLRHLPRLDIAKLLK